MVRIARVVPTPAARPPTSVLVVEIGAARIRVEAGFDRATLAAVLEVLGGGGAR